MKAPMLIKPISPRGSVSLYRCSCGNLFEAKRYNIRVGNVVSCGCYAAKVSGDRFRTHSDSGTKEHRTWKSMRSRVIRSHYYTNRGIDVCKRWDKYRNFLKDMGRCPHPRSTLERIDNNAGYGPDNCKWATWEEQANNKSNSLKITAFGEVKTLAQWARDSRCAVRRSTLRNRIVKLRWKPEPALTAGHHANFGIKRGASRIITDKMRRNWRLKALRQHRLNPRKKAS